MSGWTLFFCAAAVGMLMILWTDHVRRQHERIDKERMRGSMLYYEIYPLVLEARQHQIDHVLIERTRIVFFSLCTSSVLSAIGMISLILSGGVHTMAWRFIFLRRRTLSTILSLSILLKASSKITSRTVLLMLGVRLLT